MMFCLIGTRERTQLGSVQGPTRRQHRGASGKKEEKRRESDGLL